ncbi:MAG: hypothetical protein HY026_01275 [Deltaproteobacteria bacterium]|nr:hypothetical protein [Deltaproteobacteria bacterium]
MKDTHPDIEERFFKMIMERSGEERLRMGFEMGAIARKLVIASIIQTIPEASDKDIKAAILERFYKNEIPQDIRQKIIKRIKE